ncbi:MAG: hypothetical protein ACHQEB_07250, partial [Chitinophagales bacterium]
TGNAQIIANMVNFVNNNISGNGKLFVTVVNVFGSWMGDFITPGSKKPDAPPVANNGSNNNQNNSSNNGGNNNNSNNAGNGNNVNNTAINSGGNNGNDENRNSTDGKNFTGVWTTPGAVISLFADGRMSWQMSTGQNTSGTWRFYNNQINMIYPDQYGTNNTYVFNLFYVTQNSFTMQLSTYPNYIYQLVRNTENY